jgi:hypothetical protein
MKEHRQKRLICGSTGMVTTASTKPITNDDDDDDDDETSGENRRTDQNGKVGSLQYERDLPVVMVIVQNSYRGNFYG